MFKQLYHHNDKAYLISRRIPVHNFEKKGVVDFDFVQAWRDYLGCDHVLRDQTHFMFCETIGDVEFKEVKNDD